MSLYRFGILSRFSTRGRLLCENVLFGVSASNNVRCFKQKTEIEIPRSKQYIKALLNGSAFGLVIGVGYAGYKSYKAKDAHLVHERKEFFVIDKLPSDIKITRKIVNPNDKSNLDLILFQYQTCPFCCKVRAFLDSSGFTYSVVEVDAVLRQGIKWSPYKKVPMLLARTNDGKYVQLTESSMIISALSSYLFNPSVDLLELVKLYPSISYMDDKGDKKQDVLNKYFRIFGDKTPKAVKKEDLE